MNVVDYGETASSPGILEEVVSFVHLYIDETDPINQNVVQNLDEGESIELFRFPLSKIIEPSYLKKLYNREGSKVMTGSRVMSWMLGVFEATQILKIVM